MTRDDDQLALFQGFRPVGTQFKLSGSITTAPDQPSQEMTWCEEVTLVVRGYVKHVGYGGTPDDPGPTLGQEVKITSAYLLDEKEGDDLIAEKRADVEAVLSRRLGAPLAEAG